MRRRDLPAALAAFAALSGCATAPPATPREWFIFLELGRKTPDDRAAVAAMQRGHIDNFKRLFAEGRLFAAGPMRDPAGMKRGIVTVRASDLDELRGYFQPDEYVREGYMTLNAVPATPHKGLNTVGIDATRVEEVRIVQITRPTGDAAAAARQAFLRGLVERGVVGAWYTLHEGPVAEVLFARSTDTAALQAAFAGLPGGGEVAVWGQWLSPGVVR
jgi:uncharacterized protein YciI